MIKKTKDKKVRKYFLFKWVGITIGFFILFLVTNPVPNKKVLIAAIIAFTLFIIIPRIIIEYKIKDYINGIIKSKLLKLIIWLLIGVGYILLFILYFKKFVLFLI